MFRGRSYGFDWRLSELLFVLMMLDHISWLGGRRVVFLDHLCFHLDTILLTSKMRVGCFEDV